jgi:hypothetical protein
MEQRERIPTGNAVNTKSNDGKYDRESEPLNLTPAVHRRILNFLNQAVSSADLEHAKPLFVHDHEGVPIREHGHDATAAPRRILDHDIARRIIDFRDSEYPLGFRHMKELFGNHFLDPEPLDALRHHMGEVHYGEWSEFPHSIPRRGPGDIEGVVHAALLHTGNILFITADETTLLWNPEDLTPASFQDPLNQPHTMPEGYSQLCGHHVFLSDGQLLSVGGGGYGPNRAARWGYRFNPTARVWTRTANSMSDSRWYPTAVALGKRRVLVTCGHGTGEMDIFNEATDTFTTVDLNEKPFPSLYPGLHLTYGPHLLFENWMGNGWSRRWAVSRR